MVNILLQIFFILKCHTRRNVSNSIFAVFKIISHIIFTMVYWNYLSVREWLTTKDIKKTLAKSKQEKGNVWWIWRDEYDLIIKCVLVSDDRRPNNMNEALSWTILSCLE